jgi:Endonuclease NucS C-terminal domain
VANLLIPYVRLSDHPDPVLEEFTYGDIETRGKSLRTKLSKGDFIFFHTKIGRVKYITAYYVVDRVLATPLAVKDKLILAKYKNPHLERNPKRYRNDTLVFGDPIHSRKLFRPLLFDKRLASKLSLGIKFPKGQSETASIGFSTRSWRVLTKNDVSVLLSEIEKSEKEGPKIRKTYSAEEVREMREADLENFVVDNPDTIGEKGLKLKQRQYEITPNDRVDLLFEDRSGRLLVVELKIVDLGRSQLRQLKRYMSLVRDETRQKVRGVLVGRDVLPAFASTFKRQRDVDIFVYGWKFAIRPWGG